MTTRQCRPCQYGLSLDEIVEHLRDCRRLSVELYIGRLMGSLAGDDEIAPGVRFDAESLRLEVDGRVEWLRNLEASLLRFLIRNRGIVLTRVQILDAVWGYDFDGDPREVDVYIAKLRKHLRPRGRELIMTVTNCGYQMMR